MTRTNKERSLCKRKKGVPLEAAKVLLQAVQRKRRSLWECTLMLPWPGCPLAGQSGLAQNAERGPMAWSLTAID